MGDHDLFDIFPDVDFDGDHDLQDALFLEDMLEEEERITTSSGPSGAAYLLDDDDDDTPPRYMTSLCPTRMLLFLRLFHLFICATLHLCLLAMRPR